MSEEGTKMDLSPEEVGIVMGHRARKAKEDRMMNLKVEILRVAHEYEVWLQKNGAGSSFSTFCDEFEYQGKNRKYIFEAITAIRKDAYVSANEISNLEGAMQ